ncbi:DivIVA domain-containing protein [Schaalia sp. Marseille-Q2122]|uniref:DivIVA domain-containing protein n=1 Tax=Schaalia sp. Marseille-Q2122 TaxID=2736604 RepID=UPI001589FD33|nr:DivIVA domain-containing protein [Schaalia sp. Marseille-Q2122]
MTLLTTEDVLSKKFQYVKFREGYDQVEVDEFLDQVVKTIYTLNVENAELKEQLEAAERRIAELSAAPVAEVPAPAPVEEPAPAAFQEPAPVVADDATSASSMLALAQRVHDEYVRDGRKESEQIIAEARSKGDEIVADAQRQHETILTKLEQDRSLLEAKINELRNFESDYRTQLRGHLESLLSEVIGEQA